jgi:hypothetical protein
MCLWGYLASVVTLFVGLAGNSAHAQIVFQSEYAYYSGDPYINSGTSPQFDSLSSPPLASYSDEVQYGSTSISVSAANSLSIDSQSGSAVADLENCTESRYAISAGSSFYVTEPVAYTLAFSYYSPVGSVGEIGVSAGSYLQGFEFEPAQYPASGHGSLEFLLEPGISYSLSVESMTGNYFGGSDVASYSFSFSPTQAATEPASILLGALAFGFLALVRWRLTGSAPDQLEQISG